MVHGAAGLSGLSRDKSFKAVRDKIKNLDFDKKFHGTILSMRDWRITERKHYEPD